MKFKTLVVSLLGLAGLFSFSISAHAEIKTKAVEYKEGSTTLEGYLAYDTAGPAKKPGVLVVHDWMGMGPHPKKRAEMLAKLGYVAFAADIKGFVTFHGGLDSLHPEDAKQIKGKVLILHGADDPFVPADQVAAVEKELTDAKVDWQLIKYSGAVHSFTIQDAGSDNSKGAAYNEKADKRSWQAMKDFFAEIFK